MTTTNDPAGERLTVTLAECPIGLFWAGETLCLKTEYGNNEGRIDAYIVESGEFFWGSAPQTIANQRRQMVVPVDTDTALARLATRPAQEGALREAVERLRFNVDFARKYSSDDFRISRDDGASILAALSAPEPSHATCNDSLQVPAGWKLVPVEPTAAMTRAAFNAWMTDSEQNVMCADIYRAMLTAAPSAPEADKG